MIGTGGSPEGSKYQRADDGIWETAQYGVEYIAPKYAQFGGIHGTVYRKHIAYTTEIAANTAVVIGSLGIGSNPINYCLGAYDKDHGGLGRPVPYVLQDTVQFGIEMNFHPTNGDIGIGTGTDMALTSVLGWFDYYKA